MSYNNEDYMGDYNENDNSGDAGNHMDNLSSSKKQMPVKIHIKKQEEFIAELRRDLGESRKNGQILRSENQSLEQRSKEKSNDISKSIIDDLNNFEKEFKRVIQNDKSEMAFLQQQVNSLNQDKIKLQQSTIGLDSRMKHCEVEIGVEYN